jgi:hypothetical protein
VVRHALVQRIVRAYDVSKPQQQELPLNIGEGIEVQGQGQGREARKAQQAAKPQ